MVSARVTELHTSPHRTYSPPFTPPVGHHPCPTTERARDEWMTAAAATKMTCPTCRKWQAYIGVYDADGYTLRCHGCLRAVSKCWCR